MQAIVLKSAGSNAEGLIITTVTSGTPEFRKKATALGPFAAQGYDATKVLLNAIAKAGSTDKTAIRDALENIGTLEGVIKTYTKPFSKDNHEALSTGDITLAHWVNGLPVKVNDPILEGLQIR